MAQTLIKQGVEFDEITLKQIDGDTWIRIKYNVITDDAADPINKRFLQQTLGGVPLTRANELFTAAEAFLENKENIP
jgi:hypothetical protein